MLRKLIYVCFSLLLLLPAMTSCVEGEPNLRDKEQDSRIIGTWETDAPTAKYGPKICFTKDGRFLIVNEKTIADRIFYTDGGYKLFLFTRGDGLTTPNSLDEFEYRIVGKKLIVNDHQGRRTVKIVFKKIE